MAKATLPRIDDAPRQQEEPQRPEEQKAQHAPIVDGYLPRRVDVKMSRAHATILRNKLRQLQDVGARLKDGAIVSDKTKAILWILENLS